METPDMSDAANSIAEAIEAKAFDCPHCSKKIYLHNVASVPDKQIFTLTLESGTGAFAARTVGETITNLDRLMKAIAKDIGGKVEMFIENIERSGNALRVEFQITSVAQKLREGAKRGNRKSRIRT